MSDKANPFFAKSLVNRYWKHFFKRGLDRARGRHPRDEPADESRTAGGPGRSTSSPAAIDLKALVRVITQSHAYQLSAMPERVQRRRSPELLALLPRRLQAEVLLDAIDQLTGTKTDFANLPPGTRAVALARQQLQPDARPS